MSLRRRNGVWWVDIRTSSGERVRRSTGTPEKALALEFHDRLKAELWRIAKLGERPQRSWNEAVVRWLKEQAHKATIETDRMHFRWLDRHLGGKPLQVITRSLIDRITDAKLADGVSNATANRVLEVVRAVLRKCVNEWEWLDRAPSVRMLKEPTRRIRFLTREEAQRLLAALPEHLADMAAFSLATGLRRANVTGLQWTQVDLVRRIAWVHPDQAKARKAIAVPLNAEAVVLIRKRLGKHPTHVFSFRGEPIVQVSTKAWYTALEAAGIENFRWHDLRHTWASWLAQKGVPLNDIQEMGGWETAAMVRRYAYLSPAHLAHRAQVLDGLIDTNPAQSPESKSTSH